MLNISPHLLSFSLICKMTVLFCRMVHVTIIIPTLLPLLVSAVFYDNIGSDGYSLTTFGSKTAYANHGLRPMRAPKSRNELRLVQASVVFRHGARSPTRAFIVKMQIVRQKLKQHLLPALGDISLKSQSLGDKQLLFAGEQELRQLGERLGDHLPQRFRLANATRVFVSPTERTLQSAKQFVSTVCFQFYILS